MKHKELSKILTLPAIEAAPLLLGWSLVRQTQEGVIKLKIVETEAYHEDDPASHSFRGLTARTAPMFETGGTLYVYFTYGTHYCVNIVTGQRGRGEAVLIRAGEPIEGIEIMQRNRGPVDLFNLSNGPGKIAQALGVKSTELSGKKLAKDTLYLEMATDKIETENILAAPRIGISTAKEMPWRFYIKDNPYVSKNRQAGV